MYIPLFVKENINLDAITDSIYDSLSPSSIVASIYDSAYDFETDQYGNSLDKRDVESEAKSLWKKCMDKQACKIGAIVGICVVALLVLWILSLIVQVICCGFRCAEALCSCCGACCRGGCCNSSKGYARAAPPPPPVEKVHDYPMNYNHQQRYYV